MASRHSLAWLVVSLLALSSCRMPFLRGSEKEDGSSATGGEATASAAHVPKLLTGIGSHTHPISTRSERAQRYFNQGLVLTYGFNHGGAVDAYLAAAAEDPDCAICYWGAAYAYGPNINAPMLPDGATQAWKNLQEARKRLGTASPIEREYIEALAARYAPDPQPADRSALDLAYADAMKGVHERHPEDLDAAALYAEAVMDLHPWDYWTDDGKPRERTLEAAAILESILQRDPWHPGANHFLIHMYEEFEPKRAEAAADRLFSIAPDAGHLVHMPAHIYWRVGRYQDAWRVNEIAAASDVAYLTWCRSLPFYAALYLNHNQHFIWAASAAQGESEEAIIAARRLASGVPRDKLGELPPLEDFLTVPVLTLVRFGRWEDVLAEPRPPAELRYWSALDHYARAIAYARLGRASDAASEAAAFQKLADDPAWEKTIWVEGPLARRLDVFRHLLAGELAASRKDYAAAIPELESAAAAQDKVNYTEPPAIYFPVRQSLGAVLLDAGKPTEAEAVYRKDLEQYPKNGWSLFGLSRALAAQKKNGEAKWAERGFAEAWKRADVKLTASRF